MVWLGILELISAFHRTTTCKLVLIGCINLGDCLCCVRDCCLEVARAAATISSMLRGWHDRLMLIRSKHTLIFDFARTWQFLVSSCLQQVTWCLQLGTVWKIRTPYWCILRHTACSLCTCGLNAQFRCAACYERNWWESCCWPKRARRTP